MTKSAFEASALLESETQPRAAAGFERQEPSLGGHGAPSVVPEATEQFDDEIEEDEDEEEDEGTVIEAQLRNIWRLVNDACGESVDKGVPLHLRV